MMGRPHKPNPHKFLSLHWPSLLTAPFWSCCIPSLTWLLNRKTTLTKPLVLSISYVIQSDPLCRQESSKGNNSFQNNGTAEQALEVHRVLTAGLLLEERLEFCLICRISQKDGIRHFPLLFKTFQTRQMDPMFIWEFWSQVPTWKAKHAYKCL